MTDKPQSTSGSLLTGDALPPLEEWKTFLESIPPGRKTNIREALTRNEGNYIIAEPDLNLYCESEKCSRLMDFRCISPSRHFSDKINNIFLVYACKNCEQYQKTFSLGIISKNLYYEAFKYGEDPSFGPPIPSKTLKLFGSDRDLFFKGRICENQGLGIAAFTYYRRVVENQRNKIFDQIIKVANKVANDPELVKELEASKVETQFTRSIESIKHALPQTLLIAGENPLLLLHSALSEGLHAKEDSECLEIATHIRIILDAFAERTSMALKDDEALTTAVNRLRIAKGK